MNTIIESAGYETLTVNELFSKLKTTEVDNQTRAKLNGAPPSKSVALVTGRGCGSSSNANSALGFSLASLPSVTDEQLETLGDDDLCLLINKFQHVYRNRQRRKNPRCYHCGDPNHFIADCPKKSGGGQNNNLDYYRHRDRDEGGSNKEHRRHKYRSRDRGGRFDKESLKKRF